MVAVMQVSAPDRGRAFVLAGKLAAHGAEVVVEHGRDPVVRIVRVPERDLAGLLAVVERWIDDEDVAQAKVEIDERSYTMAH
jgi:hypothetical protein